MNDITINKIQSIQRCVARAREEYGKNPDNFENDYTAQDAAVLNILRACEQAIDLANHIVKTHKMGIPTTSSESFVLLRKKQVIDGALTERLQKMAGFRNIVIHDYQRANIEIVRAVIKSGLDDLLLFTDKIVEFCRPL